MMLKQLKFLVTALLVSLSYQSAWAWGDLGHETIAEIADQIIVKDPQLKKAIQAIIGIEPLAISSTWPDHVRSDERFKDFEPYHFITIFRDPKAKVDKDAMTVIKKYPLVLTDKKAPREAKMIAFRYLIHVIGDLHQPLHVGNEFDRGGNMCRVSWRQDEQNRPNATNLHSLWDTGLVNFVMQKYKRLAPQVKYYDYKMFAKSLVDKHADLLATKANTDVAAWVSEAENLRRTVVYPDSLPDDQRPYCQPVAPGQSFRDAVVQELAVTYAEEKSELIEKQLVLGGVRLAAFLKEIFKNSKNTKPVEAQILKLLKVSGDTHNH